MTRFARPLFLIGAAWTLVLLAAALTGGWHLGPLSITTARPLRFALIFLFAGWFLLPEEQRPSVKPRAALAFALGYGVLFRVSRWLTFEGAAFDTSLFESTLHHTLQGNFMWAWGLNRPLFSEHFEPIVLAFLPPYALFHHPLVLLIGQSLAVTLAVVPLWFALEALKLEPRFASAAYLVNAVVWQANKLEFHPELFAPLAVFWALYASVTRKWVQLYCALALALLIKEEMALVMLCFAPLILKGEGRRWPHALAVAAASVAWAALAFGWAMPASHPLGVAMHPLANRWSHLGATYPEMALTLVTSPLYVAGLVFSKPVFEVVGSLGFVPLLDPASTLMALPPLLLHLSGNYEWAAKLGAYYGLPGTCLLFVGLVFGLQRAHRRFGPRAAAAAGALAIVAAPAWPFLNRPSAADLNALSFMQTIPEGDVVCAQSPLAPHRTPTEKLQMVPFCDGPKWVLFAQGHDRWPLKDGDEYAGFVQQQRESGFAVVFSEGDYLFLRHE